MASSTSTTNSTTDPPQDLEEQIRTTLREAFAQRGYPNPVESADIGDTFAWSQFYAADGLPAAAVYRYRDKRLMANTVFKKTREAAADYNQRAGGYPEYIAIVANSNIKNGLYMDTPVAEGADPPTATMRIFKDINLTFNPLKHKAVPVHERLSADEFDRLARDYGFGGDEQKAAFKRSLPKIHSDDIVIALLGGVPGDVFRVTRQTGDRVYRQVVHDLGI